MGKPTRELLHFSDSSGDILFNQHGIISADHPVAIGLGGLGVDARAELFQHLTKDPGVTGRSATDHYCVAARFFLQGLGVGGLKNIAVPDDWDAHVRFDFPNELPACATTEALDPGSRVDCHS